MLKRTLFLGLSLLVPASVTAAQITIGNLGKGVAAPENASGTGYLLYSEENVHTRFQARQGQADHFMAVQWDGTQWIQFEDEISHSFVPRSSDILVATLDYTADTAQLHVGATELGVVQGIAKGVIATDLVITPNQWDAAPDPNEFYLTGTTLTTLNPAWWVSRDVLSGDPVANDSVANIGQLKHVANQAHAELESLVPGRVNFVPFTVPPNPDAAWYEEQKKVLNLGQLKNVASTFYQDLPSAWLVDQLDQSGIYSPDEQHPWDPDTPVADNYQVANIGQLKSVFALRFGQSTDGDQLPDLWEHHWFNSTALNDSSDWDGDGVSALEEYRQGTDPTDGITPGATIFFHVDTGNGQNWLPAGGLPNPIVFRAEDASNNPVADVEVMIIASDPTRLLEITHLNNPPPPPDPYFVSGYGPIPAVTDSDGKIQVQVK